MLNRNSKLHYFAKYLERDICRLPISWSVDLILRAIILICFQYAMYAISMNPKDEIQKGIDK